MAQDEKNVIFTVEFANEIGNPWNSPIGLSLQTIDIYIHQPERSWPGATLLLPGRGARLSKEEAWHYAVWVEGWSQGLYRVDDAGKPQKTDAPLRVVVDTAGSHGQHSGTQIRTGRQSGRLGLSMCDLLAGRISGPRCLASTGGDESGRAMAVRWRDQRLVGSRDS